MHRGGGAFRYGVAICSDRKRIEGWTRTTSSSNARRLAGEWNDDDFDVLAHGFKVNAAPVGNPWMWTLAFGYHRDRAPNHGYTATREAAMAAFAKSWRRE